MSSERVDGRTLRFQHRRPELLAAATEYVLDHGIAGLSLRRLGWTRHWG
jgi:AcrR family transcriptional regulator